MFVYAFYLGIHRREPGYLIMSIYDGKGRGRPAPKPLFSPHTCDDT